MHNSSTPIVPWHSAQGTSPIFLRKTWPPISPTLGLLHADLEWPTNPRCLWLVFFFHFSAKIYQQVSQKVAAKPCLYWALHLHNFISKPLRETTTVLFLVKRAPAQKQVVHSPSKVGRNKQKTEKKDNLGFVSASGVRREENPQYGGVVIWHTLLSDTLYFLYLRRQSGTFVIVLSWEVSFSSSAFKMAWDDPQTKIYKREQEKNFLCLCHVCGWFRRQTGCWVLQKECPRAIQSYCLTINGHHPYKLQNVQTKKDEFVHVCKILSELLQKEI